MKFTDGYWMNREEYAVNSPKEVYSYELNKDEVVLYSPYKKIITRGDTLNLGMSTITVSSPGKDMISVKLVHHQNKNQGPDFELFKEKISPII